MDYYILFRDLDDPTPIDYVKRCSQEDLLLADKTSYVWGFIGELNENQINLVRAKLVWENARRHYEAGNSFGASGLTKYAFVIELGTFEPETLNFLEKLSPNLDFLSSASPTHCFWFYPESDEESVRINQALLSLPEKNSHGFSWSMRELDYPKIHSSSVQALPLNLLMDIWKRVGYCSHMDILRHTAAILDIETTIYPGKSREKLEKTLNLSSAKAKSVSPEEAQKIFKSIVLDKKKYISALPPHQLKVLGECADIVNSIRTADGHGDKNIENIYGAVSGQRIATIIPVRKFIEQVGEPTVAPGGTPPIFIAASGKGNPKSAIDAYNESIEWADDPSEVVVKNVKEIHSPIVKTLQKTNELLEKQNSLIEKNATAPSPVYYVDAPKDATLKPEDCPVKGKGGFWVSQEEYAERVKIKSTSLTAYRKTSEGVRWSSDGTWGESKKGEHIFKKIDPSDPNSKFLYFVRTK